MSGEDAQMTPTSNKRAYNGKPIIAMTCCPLTLTVRAHVPFRRGVLLLRLELDDTHTGSHLVESSPTGLACHGVKSMLVHVEMTTNG